MLWEIVYSGSYISIFKNRDGLGFVFFFVFVPDLA